MGSSKSATVGYRYYMGLHFGLCHGPVDAVQRVVIGERSAWVGNQTASGSIAINAGELFGGDEREGGIVGQLDIMMGEPAQTENSYLVTQLGAVIPAFRGILTAVWRGGQVSSNNPYVKPWAFRVQRILQGWTGGSAWFQEKAVIERYVQAGGYFSDNFNSIDDYTISGTAGAIDSDGGVIFCLNSSVPNTTATRVFDAPITPVRMEVVFRIVIGGTGDAMTFSLLNETLSGTVFVFNARRDQGIDVDQRPTINGTAIGTTAIPWSNWYKLTLNVIDAITYVSIVKMIDQTVFYSGTVGAIGAVGGLQFLRDNDLIVSSTEFDSFTIASNDPTHRDMNPAHIVYQSLTDTAWGMGYPTSAIDSESFTAAANALFDEGFGLSLLWNRQEAIEAFVQIVLDHIGGMLYVKPDTGAFALKLIRSDYVRESLPQYGPTNLIAAADYQRQAWGETVNEITVLYTDYLSGKEASLTIQDAANIITQGAVVSQTRNYHGITYAPLAQRVAQRDLNAASTPLARIKLTATRVAWAVFPGDVFRLTWPEFGIADVVYRALNVNRGTLQDGQIIIDAVEDVFGLPENTYLVEQAGEWQDPSNEPAAAPYRTLLETPYWDLVRTLSEADMAYVDSLSGYLETLAVRPSGDATNYSIYTRTGAADYVQRGNGDFCPSATILAALTKTTTAITLENGVDLDIVEAGGYAIIGSEYVLVSAIDWQAGTATISRGVLDTVPVEHAAGSRIWFADGFHGFETTEYADAETVDVKLCPITGRGELPLTDSPSDSLTFDQRQYRPYPPGKVRFDAMEWPETIEGSTDVVLTWAHRDRTLQTAYIVEQDEASIGPEAGVTYSLEVADDALTVLHSAIGISGTTATVPASALTLGLLRFRLWSVRGGLSSWQVHEHFIEWGEAVRVTEADETRITEDGEYRVTD